MAAVSLSKFLRSTSIFTLFCFFFESINALPNSSFSLSGFGVDSEFEHIVALYGDAKVAGDALRMTASARSSSGLVMYKKHIRLVGGNPRRLLTFSTDLSFHLPPNSGDGLSFLIVPNGFNLSNLSVGSEKQNSSIVLVNFKAFSDSKNRNLIRTRLGSDSNSRWSLIRGQKLHAWIDYELGSRRLEVRLAQNGEFKPSVPLTSHPIDFSQLWEEEEELLVGLSSSNGNSSQPCLVYSWSFKLKNIPKWMHSEPLDPKAISMVKNSEAPAAKGEKNCFMRMVAAMIFGTGCGALTAFVALYLWTIFGNRQPVAPEEMAAEQKDVKYKEVVLMLEKAIKDGKKVEVLS